MAHDKSPERSNLILFYTVLSVATLIALAFVFQSYFTGALEQQRETKIRSSPNEELERLEREQRQQLRTGPMPIDRAKRELAARGRAASGSIAPEPSDDLAALEGWRLAKGRPTMGGVAVSVAELAADGGGLAPEQAGPPAPDGGVVAAGPEGGAAAPGSAPAGPGPDGSPEGSDSEGLPPDARDTTPGGAQE